MLTIKQNESFSRSEIIRWDESSSKMRDFLPDPTNICKSAFTVYFSLKKPYSDNLIRRTFENSSNSPEYLSIQKNREPISRTQSVEQEFLNRYINNENYETLIKTLLFLSCKPVNFNEENLSFQLDNQIEVENPLFYMKNEREIKEFLSEHQEITGFLPKAFIELNKYFPKGKFLLELYFSYEDEDYKQLVIYIKSDLDIEKAIDLLDKFCNKFWYENVPSFLLGVDLDFT